MSFLATVCLIVILIIRPQEIWRWLEPLRLLDVFTGLAALGVTIEIAMQKQMRLYTPQLPAVAAFLAGCYVSSVFMMGGDGLEVATKNGLIAVVFMMVIIYGVNTFGRLVLVMALLASLAGFVSAVAIHQAQVDPVCIELADDDKADISEGHPDGRSCARAAECSTDGRPEVDYACERVGLFGTVSIERRVRWRGQLNDPNELSVFLGAVIPFLFALGAHVKKKAFTVGAIATVGAWLYTVILTQSRGGQLVIGSVLAIYFVARFGLKGLIGAATLALPVLLYGGRAGETADASAHERVGLLSDGIQMFARHALVGVGVYQFAEHVSPAMTAHNSYLLAAAELGIPGFLCWSLLLWTSIKIPLTVVRRKETPDYLQPIAMGLVVSFIGVSVGIFFLSFTYKQLLFIWFGLAGALYRVAKEADPGYEVTIGRRDIAGVLACDAIVIAMIYGYASFTVS